MTALHQFGAEMLKLSKRLESFPAAVVAAPSTVSTTMDSPSSAANYSSVSSIPQPPPRLIRSTTNASIVHQQQRQHADHPDQVEVEGVANNCCDRRHHQQHPEHAGDIPPGGDDPTTNSVAHYNTPPYGTITASSGGCITGNGGANRCTLEAGSSHPFARLQSTDSPTSIEHCRNSIDRWATSTCKSEAHQGIPTTPSSLSTTKPALLLAHDGADAAAANRLHGRYANVHYY